MKKAFISILIFCSVALFGQGGGFSMRPKRLMQFQSIQGATLDQVSITFKMLNSTDTAYIDFGDGVVRTISGTSDQVLTSAYTTASTTYNIKIYGEKFHSIGKIHIYIEQTINNFNLDDLPKNLTYLSLRLI